MINNKSVRIKLISIIMISVFLMCGIAPVQAEYKESVETNEEANIAHLFDLYMTETFIMLRDDELTGNIEKVVSRIIHAAEQSDTQYRLRIINDQLPLVVSFPGYIYLSAGILDIVENESELAYLIAHVIAHAAEGIQNEAYMSTLKRSRRDNFTGSIMPFLVFTGMGGVAIAGGSLGSVATYESILMVESGIYSFSLLDQSIRAQDPDRKMIIHNRLIPFVQLPDYKTAFSAMVLINDIYTGYGIEEEKRADSSAVIYLQKAGYHAEATISVLKRFMETRNDFISRARISHIILAKPGLEKRILNAEQTLEKYR